MTDRIDPGPGWKLLKNRPIIKEGDECSYNGGPWKKTVLSPGDRGSLYSVYRRRDESLRTIKGIATRATVRVVSSNGTTKRSIRCDSGLSVGQMYAAIASFDGAVDALRNRTSVPKYIMFEIQRDPNDC